MGIKKLIDKYFPTHGNSQGESLGSVVAIWLSHILSQADHRLNHVQAWAFKRLETLKTFFGEGIGYWAIATTIATTGATNDRQHEKRPTTTMG